MRAESNVKIVAVVDSKSTEPQFLGFAAVQSYDDLPDGIDAVIVTDLSNARETAQTCNRALWRRPRSDSRICFVYASLSGSRAHHDPVAQPRWYVVQTHPHAELKAFTNLSRQGYGVFLPRYLKRRRHARRVETSRRRFSLAICFVAVDRAVQQWRCIHSTFGVSRLSCIGDEPAAVPSVWWKGCSNGRTSLASFN